MSTPRPETGIPLVQRFIAVLWPSFIVALLATVAFFFAFDPLELWPASRLGRLGAYTVGFFAFWGLGAASSALTCYFQRPCERTPRAA
jgi:hypothetical protein